MPIETAFDARSGIATLMLAFGNVNKIDEEFVAGLATAEEWAAAQPGLRGLILESAARDFCVGGDLDFIYGVTEPRRMLGFIRSLTGALRRLETLGVPVVAAIRGSALGGGYELALACHRRVALEGARVGLPEVSLGLFPGGGGTQRLPRLIGLRAGLEHILAGRAVDAHAALRLGMIDEIAADADSLRAAAERFIEQSPRAQQPWDRPGFAFPGFRPDSEEGRLFFLAACGELFQKTAGASPAPERALLAVHEGAALGITPALEVEARHFVALATSAAAKDSLRTIFFHRAHAERQASVAAAKDPRVGKVAILGADEVGAGIAAVAASRGYDVVLIDSSPDHLERASTCLAQPSLARVRMAADPTGVAGADLVIDAAEGKRGVRRDLAPLISEGGIWVTAGELGREDEPVVGLRFFAPIDAAPLVEVAVTANTSKQTLSRVLAVCLSLKKVPIVVTGAYASRLLARYALEGAQLVAEGHDPAAVEWAARSAGMATPPLQAADELGLTAIDSSARGDQASPGVALVRKLIAQGRTGKSAGRGFYEYPGGLWGGLRGRPTNPGGDVESAQERLLLVQSAEAAKCLEEGVLRTARDADLGAVLGLGYPATRGGPLAYVDRIGLPAAVEKLDALGPAYAPAPLLRRMAARGERFFPDGAARW